MTLINAATDIWTEDKDGNRTITMPRREHEDYLAGKRFQSAMTPEMWEAVIAELSEYHGPDRDEPNCKVCQALAAMYTLWPELQQP